MRLILYDRFCFVHIPFVSMVKLHFLAQFPWITFSTQSCITCITFVPLYYIHVLRYKMFHLYYRIAYPCHFSVHYQNNRSLWYYFVVLLLIQVFFLSFLFVTLSRSSLIFYLSYFQKKKKITNAVQIIFPQIFKTNYSMENVEKAILFWVKTDVSWCGKS